jgi:hypothetical protein
MRLRDFQFGVEGFPRVPGRHDWELERNGPQDTRGGGTGGPLTQLNSEAIGISKYQK